MICNLEQNTAEWLEFRKSKIGASDAPIIMGASPWCTALQLWELKVGIASPRETTQAMQRGIDLEQKAREKFTEMSEIPVFPAVFMSRIHAFMTASMDGICADNECAVEIKCAGKADHATAMSGKVPEKYIYQLQHQMYVCELNKMFYFSFNEENPIILTVQRDDKLIEEMLIKELEFYRCVKEFIPPSTSEKDYWLRSDNDWSELANQYKNACSLLSSLECNVEQLRTRLIELAQDQNCKGAGLRVNRVYRRGNVDYKKIPELQNIDLDLYRSRGTTSWRITEEK